MQKPEKNNDPDVLSKPGLIFKIIAVMLPFLILLLFEGLLRITGYGDDLSLFIQNPAEGYEKYMMVNPEIGKKYFRKLEYTAPANDIFLRDKPENTFRIFVMGSSVVYGFPYDRNLMFSRILHQRLADAYPDKYIEVVNTAITAINSYTLLDFTDEILKYEPDAILIYAGHNEFYGAFGIGSNETMSRNRGITRLHLALMDLRIYQLIRNVITGTAQRLPGSKEDEVHGTLMKRIVANKDILLNSEEYHIAMERYRQNMGDILRKAHKKGVPVFISELVCNINGMEPFCSIPDGTPETAGDVYEKARMAEESHDFESALKLYYRAKDLDCIRFRASEDVNIIIKELSEEYDAFKVPMLSWFQENTPHKLIGNNLMTEHVHPDVDGIFLMAEAFFTEISKSGILGKQDIYNTHAMEYCKLNWGYTALDTLLAHHRVQLLKGFWPFVKDEKNSVDYRKYYKPASYLDSLAFEVLKNREQSLEDVRLKLARGYEKSGQVYMAYREYEALIRMNPYRAVNYRDAGRCLLELSDLSPALKYFQKSLVFEESFYATFRIGEIYLIMGDYNNAMLYFEKSYPMAPEENRLNVLARAYMACVYARNDSRAKAIATELEKANAAQYLKIPPKMYVYNDYIPYQISTQVNRARQLLRENKSEEALVLLESSLNIYDSPIAGRIIGEIYFSQHNNERAYYYFNKVYQQFKFDPRFLHVFALICLANKDIEQARRYVQDIRLIDPGYKFLEQLTSLLL